MIPLILAAVTAAASAYAASQAGKTGKTVSSGSDTTSKGTSNQYQTSDSYSNSQYAAPGGLQPAYSNLYDMLSQYGGSPQQYYPGNTVVGPSDFTNQGIGMLQQSVSPYQEGANSLLQSAGAMNPYLRTQGQNYNFLSNAADVANNPYVQGQLRANESSVMDTLRNQMLPQLQAGAVGVNALGSSRLGLAQGQAMGDASKALAQQNASTMLNAYGQGLSAQQYALGQTGSLLGNLQMPGQTQAMAGQLMGQGADTLLNAGMIQEGYQQRAVDDALARWNFAQQAPMNQAQGLASILGQLQFTGGTTNTGHSNQYTVGNNTDLNSGTQTAPNPNYMSPVQAGIGGASVGMGLYDQYQQYQQRQAAAQPYDYPY